MRQRIPRPAHRARGCTATSAATKWLSELELTTWDGFDGYWVQRGWSKEAPGPHPVTHRHPPQGCLPGCRQRRAHRWRGLGTRPRRAEGRGRHRRRCLAGGGDLADPLNDATWVQWVLPWSTPAASGEHEDSRSAPPTVRARSRRPRSHHQLRTVPVDITPSRCAWARPTRRRRCPPRTCGWHPPTQIEPSPS